MKNGKFKCIHTDRTITEEIIWDEPVKGWNVLSVTWAGCEKLKYESPTGGHTNVAEIRAEGTCTGTFVLFFYYLDQIFIHSAYMRALHF